MRTLSKLESHYGRCSRREEYTVIEFVEMRLQLVPRCGHVTRVGCCAAQTPNAPQISSRHASCDVASDTPRAVATRLVAYTVYEHTRTRHTVRARGHCGICARAVPVGRGGRVCGGVL